MNDDSQSNDEFTELIEQYEAAREENRTIYLDSEDYCDIANFYLKENKITEAHEAVTRGLSIHSHHSELLAIRTTLYLIENKLNEARETLNLITDRENIYAKVAEIELLTREGQEDRATDLLKNIKSKDLQPDIALLLTITYLYFDLGLIKEALLWIQSMVSDKPFDDDSFMEVLAECYSTLDKHKEASDLYNQLIDKDPYCPEYWIGLATSCFNQDQFDKAIEACDFALVSDEDNGDAHTIKGNSFFQLGNYETAIEEYKKAKLAPEIFYLFTGYCHVALEDYQTAFHFFSESLSHLKEGHPLTAHVMQNCSKCLWGLDQPEEAYKYCATLQERFPDLPEGYMLHGELLMKEDKVEEAMKQWEKVLTLSDNASTWFQMGVASFNAGHYPEAETFFKRIEEINPEFEDINRYFTLIYLYLGDEEKFLSYKKKFFESIDMDNDKPMDPVTFFELLDEDIENITEEAKELLSKLW